MVRISLAGGLVFNQNLGSEGESPLHSWREERKRVPGRGSSSVQWARGGIVICVRDRKKSYWAGMEREKMKESNWQFGQNGN